MDTKWLYFIG